MSFTGGTGSAKMDAKNVRSKLVDDRKGWDGKDGTIGEFWHRNSVEEVEFNRGFDAKGFDIVYGALGFGSTFVLYGVAVGVSGVEGKAKCFEGFAELVVGKGGFEVVTGVFGGTVGYGFGEVYELVSEGVELGTVSVGVDERLGGVIGSGYSEVINVNGSEDIGDGVETFEENSEECINGKDTHGTALVKSIGVELFAADFVELEKSSVGGVKFVGGSGDLGWETDGVEKLIGEG